MHTACQTLKQARKLHKEAIELGWPYLSLVHFWHHLKKHQSPRAWCLKELLVVGVGQKLTKSCDASVTDTITSQWLALLASSIQHCWWWPEFCAWLAHVRGIYHSWLSNTVFQCCGCCCICCYLDQHPGLSILTFRPLLWTIMASSQWPQLQASPASVSWILVCCFCHSAMISRPLRPG